MESLLQLAVPAQKQSQLAKNRHGWTCTSWRSLVGLGDVRVSVVKLLHAIFYLKALATDPECPEARPCHSQWGKSHHLNVAPNVVLGPGRDEASGHGLGLPTVMCAHQPLVISSARPAIIG